MNADDKLFIKIYCLGMIIALLFIWIVLYTNHRVGDHPAKQGAVSRPLSEREQMIANWDSQIRLNLLTNSVAKRYWYDEPQLSIGMEGQLKAVARRYPDPPRGLK